MASDQISRTEAIQAISDWIKDCDNESINDAVTVIKTLIELLPAVDAIPVDWIKLNIAISALVEDDEAASLLLTLVDAWHKSGWSLFDGVLPAEEAKKYGIKPREAE